MVGLEAAMLASAALAFTLFLWLLLYGRDNSRADFAAYADAHGWNHRHDAPLHLVSSMTRLAETAPDGLRCGPYFAGPSGAGPFQVMGVVPQRTAPHASRSGAPDERTFVHIRTATSSPGIRFGPRDAFQPADDDQDVVAAVGHSAWCDRYALAATDARFVASALDYEACQLLLQPKHGIQCDWKGHDLYLMFPLRPSTMAGYETLLRYSVALVRRLQRHDGRSIPLDAQPAPVPAPQGAMDADALAV